MSHAVLLHFAGRDDEARAAARKLEDLRDGHALFNTACLQCDAERLFRRHPHVSQSDPGGISKYAGHKIISGRRGRRPRHAERHAGVGGGAGVGGENRGGRKNECLISSSPIPRKTANRRSSLRNCLLRLVSPCGSIKSGIEAATSWSEEIVNALDGCKAFIVMLSPHSIESKNVVREVSLAFEKNKKILPLDLEPVSLPASMQYHLAGLQRTSMTNIDAVIRALGKLGLAATQAPSIKLVHETDGRKSLMILPFEDMSPTGDNGWFADGLASELISALSNVKALRVADPQATKDFKRYQGNVAEICE